MPDEVDNQVEVDDQVESDNPFVEINRRVEAGESPQVSVRTILSWYGAHRRSWRNVLLIRDDLDQLDLETVPDFESPHIDTAVTFRRETVFPPPTIPAPQETSKESTAPITRVVSDSGIAMDTLTVVKQAEPTEPAHQISRLRSANTPPVCVKPDTTVQEAITIMLVQDFSQLPVMQSVRGDPKGLFSWKSLGSRLALGRVCNFVRECMNDITELSSDDSLYDAIPLIVKHECVLIRDATNKVVGIVTPADLSVQFQELAEPFLLLGAIENHLRTWISSKFTNADLQAAKDPGDTERVINDVSDLSFGEYVRLLENPEQWKKLEMSLDRKTFTGQLDKIRAIRNDVMHFDPDPMDLDDLKTLRVFWQSLQQLETIRGK